MDLSRDEEPKRTFGGDAYYGAESFDSGEAAREELAQKVLGTLLGPEEKDQVNQAVRLWNSRIRDLLRRETALRLFIDGDQVAVPIRVVDGIAPPIESLMRDYEDPAIWWLIAHKPMLLKVKSGLTTIETNFDLLARLIKRSVPLAADQMLLQAVIRFLKQLDDVAEVNEVEQKIREIEVDYLGAYWFQKPEIQLYWRVISIVSGLLDVSIEDLTVIVLSHELVNGGVISGQRGGAISGQCE